MSAGCAKEQEQPTKGQLLSRAQDSVRRRAMLAARPRWICREVLDLPRRIQRRCANWAAFMSTKDNLCRPIRCSRNLWNCSQIIPK